MVRDWLRRRRREEQRAEEIRAQLLTEYLAKAEAGDPTVAEASRDFADNDGTSWNMQVGLSAIVVGFIVSTMVLFAFFMGIKTLIGD